MKPWGGCGRGGTPPGHAAKGYGGALEGPPLGCRAEPQETKIFLIHKKIKNVIFYIDLYR